MERDNWVLLKGRCFGSLLSALVMYFFLGYGRSPDASSFEPQCRFTLGHDAFLYSSGYIGDLILLNLFQSF